MAYGSYEPSHVDLHCLHTFFQVGIVERVKQQNNYMFVSVLMFSFGQNVFIS